MLTYGSLFTGIGGFDLGFDRAGMRCAWQIEKDKDCNRVLGRHWPDTERGNDVREVTPDRFAGVDVICGGFPCQDLSVAGNRKGLAGERSGLWQEFRRIIDEFRPCFCVVENVPGLFSSHGGRDYLTVLRGLAELGYCVAGTVLDSQYFGVPQRRDRVFLVGSLGNGSCAEILFESESLRGDPAPSRKAGQAVAGTIGGSSQSGGFRTTDLDNNGAFIAARMTAFGEYVDDGTASTLKQRDYKDATDLVAFSCKDHGADAGEVSPTLRSMEFDGSHANGGGQVAIAIAHRTSGNCGVMPQGDRTAALNTATDPNQNIVQLGMMVRRLTPRECERLQGFPDDHTRWDATGKEISDSARYRMLGNAVTTFPAEWIGKRIVQFAPANGN
jgi:DNA (cytosine-5)-methyltransferase 1